MSNQSLYIVTQRKALSGDFIKHLKALVLASSKIIDDSALKLGGIILREKDLNKEEFESLVKELALFCHSYSMPLFLNADISFSYDLALEYQCGIHTSFLNYKELISQKNLSEKMKNIPFGVSIHSIEEAEFIRDRMQILNLQNLLAGHVFETDCKQGLEGRGLTFLKSIKESLENTSLNLLAIGGINQENAKPVFENGADGIAIMSLAMQKEFNEKEALEFLETFSMKD